MGNNLQSESPQIQSEANCLNEKSQMQSQNYFSHRFIPPQQMAHHSPTRPLSLTPSPQKKESQSFFASQQILDYPETSANTASAALAYATNQQMISLQQKMQSSKKARHPNQIVPDEGVEEAEESKQKVTNLQSNIQNMKGFSKKVSQPNGSNTPNINDSKHGSLTQVGSKQSQDSSLKKKKQLHNYKTQQSDYSQKSLKEKVNQNKVKKDEGFFSARAIQQKIAMFSGVSQNSIISAFFRSQRKTQRICIRVYYSLMEYMNVVLLDENEGEQESDRTSGWLTDQVIKQYSERVSQLPILRKQHPISLSTTDDELECIDYLLTQREEPLINFLTFKQNKKEEKQRDGKHIEVIFADQELKINFISDEEYQHEQRRIKQRKSNLYPPSLKDYEMIKVLGTGGFSQVLMVRKKVTGKLYAMKVINKKHIVDTNKVQQIIAERKILTMLDHPFIVQLHCSFTSKSYLYLVLDLCPGGELFYYINKFKKFTETQSKVYFAEILLTLEYLHSNNILYRDLKPENILIDESGHIKLTDFGLSRMDFKPTDLAETFCGSPEYMSPEMLNQSGHSFELDIYCLGVLLYELLTGLPPHYNQNRMQMYQDIMFKRESFPSTLSENAIDLLSKMLEKDPHQRISIKQIKRHSFCSDINWDLIFEKKLIAPICINIHQSNFEKEYTKMKIVINPDEEEDILYKARTSVNDLRNKRARSHSRELIEEAERLDTINSMDQPTYMQNSKVFQAQRDIQTAKHYAKKDQLMSSNEFQEEGENFSAQVLRQSQDHNGAFDEVNQILRRSSAFGIKRISTPTFKDFIYRKQTLKNLPFIDGLQDLQQHDSPLNFPKTQNQKYRERIDSIQVQLVDLTDDKDLQLISHNECSYQQSILTEHVDGIRGNLEQMMQVHEKKPLQNFLNYQSNGVLSGSQQKDQDISNIKTMSLIEQIEQENKIGSIMIQNYELPRHDEKSIHSEQQERLEFLENDNDSSLKSSDSISQDNRNADDVLLQEREDQDGRNPYLSSEKAKISDNMNQDARVNLCAQVNQIERREDARNSFDPVLTLQSDDFSPIRRQQKIDIQRIIERDFNWFKNCHPEYQVPTYSHKLEGSQQLKQARKGINVFPQNHKKNIFSGHSNQNYSERTSNQLKKRTSNLKQFLVQDSQEKEHRVVSKKQSQNMFHYTEKANGIISERRRESNLFVSFNKGGNIQHNVEYNDKIKIASSSQNNLASKEIYHDRGGQAAASISNQNSNYHRDEDLTPIKQLDKIEPRLTIISVKNQIRQTMDEEKVSQFEAAEAYQDSSLFGLTNLEAKIKGAQDQLRLSVNKNQNSMKIKDASSKVVQEIDLSQAHKIKSFQKLREAQQSQRSVSRSKLASIERKVITQHQTPQTMKSQIQDMQAHRRQNLQTQQDLYFKTKTLKQPRLSEAPDLELNSLKRLFSARPSIESQRLTDNNGKLEIGAKSRNNMVNYIKSQNAQYNNMPQKEQNVKRLLSQSSGRHHNNQTPATAKMSHKQLLESQKGSQGDQESFLQAFKTQAPQSQRPSIVVHAHKGSNPYQQDSLLQKALAYKLKDFKASKKGNTLMSPKSTTKQQNQNQMKFESETIKTNSKEINNATGKSGQGTAQQQDSRISDKNSVNSLREKYNQSSQQSMTISQGFQIKDSKGTYRKSIKLQKDAQPYVQKEISSVQYGSQREKSQGRSKQQTTELFTSRTIDLIKPQILKGQKVAQKQKDLSKKEATQKKLKSSSSTHITPVSMNKQKFNRRDSNTNKQGLESKRTSQPLTQMNELEDSITEFDAEIDEVRKIIIESPSCIVQDDQDDDDQILQFRQNTPLSMFKSSNFTSQLGLNSFASKHASPRLEYDKFSMQTVVPIETDQQSQNDLVQKEHKQYLPSFSQKLKTFTSRRMTQQSQMSNHEPSSTQAMNKDQSISNKTFQQISDQSSIQAKKHTQSQNQAGGILNQFSSQNKSQLKIQAHKNIGSTNTSFYATKLSTQNQYLTAREKSQGRVIDLQNAHAQERQLQINSKKSSNRLFSPPPQKPQDKVDLLNSSSIQSSQIKKSQKEIKTQSALQAAISSQRLTNINKKPQVIEIKVTKNQVSSGVLHQNSSQSYLDLSSLYKTSVHQNKGNQSLNSSMMSSSKPHYQILKNNHTQVSLGIDLSKVKLENSFFNPQSASGNPATATQFYKESKAPKQQILSKDSRVNSTFISSHGKINHSARVQQIDLNSSNLEHKPSKAKQLKLSSRHFKEELEDDEEDENLFERNESQQDINLLHFGMNQEKYMTANPDQIDKMKLVQRNAINKSVIVDQHRTSTPKTERNSKKSKSRVVATIFATESRRQTEVYSNQSSKTVQLMKQKSKINQKIGGIISSPEVSLSKPSIMQAQTSSQPVINNFLNFQQSARATTHNQSKFASNKNAL